MFLTGVPAASLVRRRESPSTARVEVRALIEEGGVKSDGIQIRVNQAVEPKVQVISISRSRLEKSGLLFSTDQAMSTTPKTTLTKDGQFFYATEPMIYRLESVTVEEATSWTYILRLPTVMTQALSSSRERI